MGTTSSTAIPVCGPFCSSQASTRPGDSSNRSLDAAEVLVTSFMSSTMAVAARALAKFRPESRGQARAPMTRFCALPEFMEVTGTSMW